MSKQINVRLDPVHLALLESIEKKMKENDIPTSKTDVIQKALYVFARETVLGAEEVAEIIDEHYRGPFEMWDD